MKTKYIILRLAMHDSYTEIPFQCYLQKGDKTPKQRDGYFDTEEEAQDTLNDLDAGSFIIMPVTIK